MSQFVQAPQQDHFDAAIWVSRNMKSHPGQGIFLCADSDLQLHAYCDTDWEVAL